MLLAEVISSENGLAAALLAAIGLLGAFMRIHAAAETDNRQERKESNAVIVGLTETNVALTAAVTHLGELVQASVAKPKRRSRKR